MEVRTVGRVALQAVSVGVVAGAVYALMRVFGAPLCPPTGVSCAVEDSSALLAVPLGGLATALALHVLARRAGLGWAFTSLATAALLAVNLPGLLVLSGMWTVLW
ncbi:hypothetical protein [Kribbella sp. NPDC048915]|uniref:hypothetical protein n=1 Tax=Kribbella sp. NPDC048915 TaxID=3155148 RepID=UPI00340BF07C